MCVIIVNLSLFPHFSGVFSIMNKIVIFTTLIGVSTFTLAQAESAHQHGVANVNIAISKQALVIELDTPADNVLGFEHEPRTEQQKQHLSDTLLLLNRADSLFNIPSSAECKVQQVKIENPFAHEEHAEDEHDEHAKNTHEEHETHSDFEILYTYDCQHQLSNINMAGLFKHFPNFITLKVQWVNENKQSAKTVTKKDNQVNFNE
ncbi:MAG: hypothetical protein DRQ49_17910 [Gammaproteobacteria bacterium]|nr:MAG: hypothetical protein DRQ49_17910 [Gammaproteobacteria bacterium]